MTAILCVSFFARVNYFERELPYCQHVDENTWTTRSFAMLEDSDLNPHRFTKPSVMVYLNTAGLALGLIRTGAHRHHEFRPSSLGKSAYPYYRSPIAIETVRYIYALLSVLAMAMAALCVLRVTKSRGVALLALLFMAGSGEYFRYSYQYLNVDILGVFFAMTAISYALLRAPMTSPAAATVICGLLAGFTLGTKYNLFWIAVPMLVAISSVRRLLLERVVLFFVVMLLGFVITTPYALLDMRAFVHDAAGEAYYASGHRNNTEAAGILMFSRYASTFIGTSGCFFSRCPATASIEPLFGTPERRSSFFPIRSYCSFT